MPECATTHKHTHIRTNIPIYALLTHALPSAYHNHRG